MFVLPPNALPPPKIPPLGAGAAPPPPPPGAFPAPGPPNAELLVVFVPRLPNALVAGVGAPWFLF